jgi:hypothetical protein
VIAEAQWQANLPQHAYDIAIYKLIELNPYVFLSHSEFVCYTEREPFGPAKIHKACISQSDSERRVLTLFFWYSCCLDERPPCIHSSCERGLRRK